MAQTDSGLNGGIELDSVIAKVIIPDKDGITAGDGMYSIALPDGSSLFLMGDSFVGEVKDGKRSTSDRMYRNTYILYDEGNAIGIYGFGGDKNASAAVPPGYPNEEKWYWPGHGFVNGDKLYIFQTLMYQGGEGMWGFMYETTHILEYKLPGLELKRTEPIPFKGSTDIHYGMAALSDGDYNYIYTFIADSPTGPWRNKKLIFRTLEQDIPNLFTYNAMAHPQFEKDGKILVSYNVNSLEFSNLFNDVSTYRPRFFWVDIDQIIE